ncbi:dihydrofolate reductase family protein [Microlunatus parietis]|uniref:Dihydrofolate reductase n=1 Tax=Microlunatus parietis TaxID=682979 RepID=A0A7Y9I5X4_9ACTN|nr:dihydrofolate reductase family protein [Microlunatus parietis]NYE70797.1 dihydrofolate reductase [Microlunatus parietis]
MNRVIVIKFSTVDGVVEDPDGSDGTPFGGWALRTGRAAVADDKFRLGDKLETGALLFGRATWQLFSRRWPSRTDPYAVRMNRARKYVASRTLTDVTAWANSELIKDDLIGSVRALRERHDVIVIGSIGLAAALADHDLVDEYRVLIFPAAAGAGRRLFGPNVPRRELRLVSAEALGVVALLRYEVADQGNVSDSASSTARS